MSCERRQRQHEEAAQREDSAASRAETDLDAHLHATLALMHRREAAKLLSIRQVLTMAFGD